MFQELKMKSFKEELLVILVMAVLGIFFTALSFDGILALTGGKQNLDTMTADQIKPGMYVEGTVYGIYDSYAYTEEKKSGSPAKVVSKEYVFPVGKGEYMGLFAPRKYVEGCDELMQASWDYLDGLSEEISGQFVVKGTILAMDSESLQYYREYLTDYADYDSLSDQEKAAFLPYYLKIDFIGDASASSFVTFLVIAAVCFLLMIWVLVRVFSGSFQKSLKKYCRENGAEERVEQFYRNTVPVEGMRINREFVMGTGGGATIFFPAGELVWAYMQITTHKRNFITVGKSYNVILRTKNGEQHNHSVKKEAAAQNLLAELQRQLPGIIVGYDKEIEKLYHKNRAELIAQVEAGRAELEGNFAAGYGQEGTF